MAQAATLKSSGRAKTVARQEEQLAQLANQLEQAGSRISASLDNINRLLEATVEEMRLARQIRETDSKHS